VPRRVQRAYQLSPRIPNVPRNPDAVPGSVKAVETTPIRMLGATNAVAAAAGVRNLEAPRPDGG
jgi:hypothetical protein